MGNTLALVMDFKGMQAQKAAAAAERQQAQIAGEMAEISTQQDVVDRGRALYEQLAALNTGFAGSGLSGAGATKQNFGRMEKKFSKDDIASRKVMGSAERRKYQLTGFGAKMSGKAAGYKFGSKVGKYASGQAQNNPGGDWKLM
tara:strand:+ start:94 stop:525 length:432 start_codon:yes stop_codon:yes gene_type:complete